MIWYFGTSHTAGQCDNQQWGRIMPHPYPDLVSDAVGHDYLNFAQEGADNTEIYFLLRNAVLDKKLPDPDIIIFECRPYYDLPAFPDWKYCGKEIKAKWEIKSVYNRNHIKTKAYQERYFFNVYRLWRKAMRDIPNGSHEEIFESIAKGVGATGEEGSRKINYYRQWLGKWWENFMEFWVNIRNSGHILNTLKLEQEIFSMVALANIRAKKVGYMFVDTSAVTRFNKLAIHENCILNDVKGWLKENEPDAYRKSCNECPDEHMGPSGHKAITKPIVEWINGS
tara:strand:- start:1785 stop:2630 length:846 start_codon:yes stop_codon:yes gene_type:complete